MNQKITIASSEQKARELPRERLYFYFSVKAVGEKVGEEKELELTFLFAFLHFQSRETFSRLRGEAKSLRKSRMAWWADGSQRRTSSNVLWQKTFRFVVSFM
jgi:predicted secreted protein